MATSTEPTARAELDACPGVEKKILTALRRRWHSELNFGHGTDSQSCFVCRESARVAARAVVRDG